MSHREPRRQLTNLRAALLTGGGGVLFEVGGEGGWVRVLGGPVERQGASPRVELRLAG